MVRRESQLTKNKGEYYWCCNRFRAGRYGSVGVNSCCNGIRIKYAVPEEIFIKAWNQLVENQEWQQITRDKDALEKYRVAELIRLTGSVEIIDKMPYELMLKTLNHIKIDVDGAVEAVFLAGPIVNIKLNN